MSKNLTVQEQIGYQWFEASWPYDLAESSLDQDLGADSGALLEGSDVAVTIFKRPWFKQNYHSRPKKNLKLYRRPYFHVAEE